MTLHARAQRRATHPRRRPRTPRRRPQLSVTVDTLPPDDPFLCVETSPDHWHIIARDGAAFGQIAWAYAFDRHTLPTWAGPRLFAAVGVVSPAVDVRAYHRSRWWDLDWEVGPTDAEVLEDLAGPDMITRWPHAWLL